MSREYTGGLLFRHFEKLCVAAVGVVVIVYLVGIAVDGTEAAQLKLQADEAISEITLARQNPNLPEKLDVNFPGELATEFVNVPVIRRGPAWFAYKRPYILREAEFEPPLLPLHFTPVLSAGADIGQIALTWKDSPRNENVVIDTYELYRRKGNGTWKRMRQFAPGTSSYIDMGLEHEEQYSYKVVSFARPAPGVDPFLNPADAGKETGPLAMKTPFNLDFEILGGGMGRLSVIKRLLKPGGRVEAEKDIFRVGKKVIIKGQNTGWSVSKVGDDFFEITKPGRDTKRFAR